MAFNPLNYELDQSGAERREQAWRLRSVYMPYVLVYGCSIVVNLAATTANRQK